LKHPAVPCQIAESRRHSLPPQIRATGYRIRK